MTIYDLGFSVEEIDSKEFDTCYIASWSAKRSKNSPFQGDLRGVPGAFFLRMAGGGRIASSWGAGRSTYDDFLRGSGVARALEMRDPTRTLLVRTVGLWDQLRPDDGYVRYAIDNGGLNKRRVPFDGYETLSGIAEALDNGLWQLEQIKKREEPFGYSKVGEAVGELPRRTAEAYGGSLATLTDANIIIATDQDPDPSNLLGPASTGL